MSGPREVTTRVARARWDDHRYMGYGALSELLGKETFLGLTFMAATDGRRPTPEERNLLDALAVSMAAADPRIWPLKITRLVAAYGGTIAGFVAGQLCTECDAIGPWVTGPAAELLQSVRAAVGHLGASDTDFHTAVKAWLETHRRLSGYGVAFRADDERFLALSAHVERAGRAGLPFWRLQHRLSEVLRQERGLEPKHRPRSCSLASGHGPLCRGGANHHEPGEREHLLRERHRGGAPAVRGPAGAAGRLGALRGPGSSAVAGGQVGCQRYGIPRSGLALRPASP